MNQYKSKLVYKMLILFSILSIGPLLFARWVIVGVARGMMMRQVLEVQHGIVNRTGERIYDYLANALNSMNTLQKQPRFSTLNLLNIRNVHESVLTKFMEDKPIFLECLSVGKEDTQVYEILRLTQTGYPELPDSVYGTKEVVRNVEEKGYFIGDKVEFIPLAGAVHPVVTLAVPIEDERQNIIGILSSRISLLLDLSGESGIVGGTKLGEQIIEPKSAGSPFLGKSKGKDNINEPESKTTQSAYTYMTDFDGRLMAHPQLDKVRTGGIYGEQLTVRKLLDRIKKMQARGKDVLGQLSKNFFQPRKSIPSLSTRQDKVPFIYEEESNQITLCEPVQGSYLGAAEVLPWYVFLQIPAEQVYRVINNMRRQVDIFLLIVMFVAIGLGFFSAHYLIQPIKLLQKGTEKISQGDFNVDVTVNSNDEIGELSEKFALMAHSLKEKTQQLNQANSELSKLNTTLEHKVVERTRKIQEMQDELVKRERLAAVGQMANIIGHEIRNPLAIINNSAYYLKTKIAMLSNDEKINKHLNIIESEINTANKIVNDLLGFSRTRELQAHPLVINEILEEITSRYPVPTNMNLVAKYDKNVPISLIDRDEMRQVFLNLIGNAFQSMSTGGTVTVISKYNESDLNYFNGSPSIQVEINDTGSGIPPEVLEKMFQPFFTTKSKGTGLGLAVVQKVVDRHNGKVDVKSVVGQGTTFIICFPVTSQSTDSTGVKPR